MATRAEEMMRTENGERRKVMWRTSRDEVKNEALDENSGCDDFKKTDREIAEDLVANDYDLKRLEHDRLNLLKTIDQWQRSDVEASEVGLPHALTHRSGNKVRTFATADIVARLARMFMPDAESWNSLALSSDTAQACEKIRPDAVAEYLTGQGSIAPLAWSCVGAESKLTLCFFAGWPSGTLDIDVSVDGQQVSPTDIVSVLDDNLLHLRLPIAGRPLRTCLIEKAGGSLRVVIATTSPVIE